MAKKTKDGGAVEEKVPEVVKAPEKKKVIKITASYIVVERDTNVTSRQTYQGEGATAEEALAELKFPSSVNCLVNTKVECDDRVIEKALAPHNARRILGGKNVALFNATYKGFV